MKVLEAEKFKECEEFKRDLLLLSGIENVEMFKVEYFQKEELVKTKLKSILLKKVDEYKNIRGGKS